MTIDAAAPNDPLYTSGQQWNLAKIGAPQAWEITKGTSKVVVGLIESGGVKRTHPDFVNADSTSQFLSGFGSPSANSDHGTKVASAIGAATNNGTGIASLGIGLKMIPYQYTPDAFGTDLVAAIDLSITNGCDVLNLSFMTAQKYRWPPCDKPGKTCYLILPVDYGSVRLAIQRAITAGVIVVAAAGNAHLNEGSDDFEKCNPDCAELPYDAYPASYPGVLGISATDLNDVFAGGEDWNYGDFVDLAAPGYQLVLAGFNGADTYDVDSGTSFAAPHTAALIGLLLSVNRDLTLGQIEDVLFSTADRPLAYEFPNGWNGHLGHGRINAAAAVQKVFNDHAVKKSGTISSNATWTGTVFLTNNVTVNSGIALTIAAGSEVYVNSGSGLTVNGTLNVQGSTNNPVLIDVYGTGNTWQGIHFQSGSTGSVSYANIKAATKGVRVTSSSPTIQNCTIEKFSEQGIYVTNGSPTIQANTINGWSGSARVGTGIYVDNSGLGSSTLSISGGNVVKGCIVGMSLEGPFGSVTQNTFGVYSGQASTSNTYGIIRYGGGTISNNKVYGDADDSYGISLRSGSGGAVAASQNLLDHHGMGLIDEGWQAGLVSNNSFTNNQISFVSSDGIMEAHNNDFWDSQSTSYNMWVLSEPPVYFDDNYLESWATSSDPKYYDCCSGNDPWYPPSASPNSAGPSWKVIRTKRPTDDLIANQPEAIPAGFGLSTYPNPFNPSTTVQIDLPEPTSVTLSIYDILGREVDRLLSGPLTAGVHRIEWNGTDSRGRQLSSGVYLIRLEAGERVFTHRVLFAK